MSAISQAALPSSQVALRSILPRRSTIHVPNPGRRQHPRHWNAALRLVGHLATTAFAFVSLITLAWIASWIFSVLHSAHPFSDDAFRFFVGLEGVLIRLDAAACGIVLLFGVGRYVLNVIKGNS